MDKMIASNDQEISKIIEFAAFELDANTSDQGATICNPNELSMILDAADKAMDAFGASSAKKLAFAYATNEDNDGAERLVAAFLASKDEVADHPSAKILGDLGTSMLASNHFIVKMFADTQLAKTAVGTARESGLKRIAQALTFANRPKTYP